MKIKDEAIMVRTDVLIPGLGDFNLKKLNDGLVRMAEQVPPGEGPDAYMQAKRFSVSLQEPLVPFFIQIARQCSDAIPPNAQRGVVRMFQDPNIWG